MVHSTKARERAATRTSDYIYSLVTNPSLDNPRIHIEYALSFSLQNLCERISVVYKSVFSDIQNIAKKLLSWISIT